MERRLSAILAADVVAYSRMVEADEVSTLDRVRANRQELIEPEVRKRQGRIFKLMGDGLLAEFASVVKAVECAVAIQRGMAERNAGLAESSRLDLRIGVNLGDVLVEGDDLLGDGVNIAARLQAAAEPGGICISGTVFDQIRTKVALPYRFAGEQRVKNITQPVRIYHVALDPGAKARLPWSLRRRLVVAAIPILLVAFGAGAAIIAHWHGAATRDRPSIAVLPFTNMSDDPKQDYLADGISEDLITDLANVSGLFVMSRNATFVFKGKAVVPSEVAKTLGVRYMLEGSVRREGDLLRVNAQLIDGTTGGHIWAKRYDRTMTEVFSLQDDITRSIVNALQVELSEVDQYRVAQIETSNVLAYDAFLQGWELYHKNSAQTHGAAIPLLEQAIALDPSYGRAHAALAVVYFDIADATWSQQLGLDEAQVRRLSREQLDLALEHPTSTAHLLQGEMLRIAGHYDEAITEAERAVALDPSDSLALANLSNLLSSAGRARDGLDAVKSALRIDPNLSFYLHYLAKAQFGLGDFTAAAKTWEEGTARSPDQTWWFLFLASAYGHLGRLSDAKAALAKANAGFAGWAETTVLLGAALAYKNQADLDRVLDGLRKAGAPELPFNLDPKAPDRLDGDAIRRLLFGHTVRGQDADGPFELTRAADGVISGSAEKGQSVIEDSRLCDVYETSGRVCGVVYRNPAGSAAEQNEYLYVLPWKQAAFSVTE